MVSRIPHGCPRLACVAIRSLHIFVWDGFANTLVDSRLRWSPLPRKGPNQLTKLEVSPATSEFSKYNPCLWMVRECSFCNASHSPSLAMMALDTGRYRLWPLKQQVFMPLRDERLMPLLDFSSYPFVKKRIIGMPHLGLDCANVSRVSLGTIGRFR